MRDLFRIGEEPLHAEPAIEAVGGPDRGAVALFLGTVRNEHGGRRVLHLEYHAYQAMAEESFRQIGREVRERFGAVSLAILHRTGILAIGDTSVVIAAGAPHRAEALAACSYAIERLKAIAPIWKKEHYAEGTAWIEGRDPDPGPGAG